MIAVGGNLYAVEPNHGELDKITPEGQISRVSDISASQGHIVPTAIAYRGNFYVGNLNTFPVVPGSSKILKITPSGNVKRFRRGTHHRSWRGFRWERSNVRVGDQHSAR